MKTKTGLILLAAASTGLWLGYFSPLKAEMNQLINLKQMNMDHSMDLGPADVNYDLRFIDGMILHHQGALTMSQEALAKSKRPEIQQLASNIITAQEQEIAQLRQWRQEWYPQAPAEPQGWANGMNHMMGMSEEQMSSMRMDQDLGAGDAEFDLRFINAMIPHHQGAVVMAEDALAKSTRSEIQSLAQGIISSQSGEIKQMEQWRKDWYGK